MDNIRVGDLVQWTKIQYDQFDEARGGTGTVIAYGDGKITIEATDIVRQESVRFTFRLDEVTLKKLQ